MHCLSVLHLEALGVRVLLWDSLVALGSCHHLDGLVQRRRIGMSSLIVHGHLR